MNAAVEIAEETCLVNCYNCQNTLDATDAVWCTCLTSERTLVCPSCMQCFCRAPKAYKDKFWNDAPQSLWDLKIAEEKELFCKPNPAPEFVNRPLILIVDDEPMIQGTAARAIEKFGYGTILARDGMEGLALAKKYKPDMILSDMLMPKMEGIELCRFLKADPETNKIKVVLMTSLYTKAKHRTETYRTANPDEYLMKPLDFNQLWDVLKKHLA